VSSRTHLKLRAKRDLRLFATVRAARLQIFQQPQKSPFRLGILTKISPGVAHLLMYPAPRVESPVDRAKTFQNKSGIFAERLQGTRFLERLPGNGHFRLLT